MLKVELDHILSEQDAAQKIQNIFTQVEQAGDMYVITKDGKPMVAIVNINQLDPDKQEMANSTPPEVAAPMDASPAPAPEMELPDLPPLPASDPAADTLPTPPALPLPPTEPTAPTPTPPQPLPTFTPAPTIPDGSPLSDDVPDTAPAAPAPIPAPNLPPLSGTDTLQTPPQQYSVPNN